MEENKDFNRILDLMTQPVFCVRDGQILYRNHAAKQLFIEPGLPVDELLGDATEDYGQFEGSALYLNLTLPGITLGASVTRLEDMDIFVTEQPHSELQAMSLAATQLRQPLSDVLLILNQADVQANPAYLGQLNRRLFQMQRLVFNMSDAARYATDSTLPKYSMNICSVVEELFKKVELLAERSGITLIHSCPQERIMTLLNVEKLERAVYNMISNAMKVTVAGGTIEAKFTCRQQRLYLSVRDYGRGIPHEVLGNIFTRYLRHPGICNGDEGLGLGMSLIRSAALEHGGAVWIDHPDGVGTRVTISLAIRKNPDSMVRSDVLSWDYAGDYDHALVELSDSLPPELYRKEI